jgi:hypothetical protein
MIACVPKGSETQNAPHKTKYQCFLPYSVVHSDSFLLFACETNVSVFILDVSEAAA